MIQTYPISKTMEEKLCVETNEKDRMTETDLIKKDHEPAVKPNHNGMQNRRLI
jgi:hypothetical protein